MPKAKSKGPENDVIPTALQLFTQKGFSKVTLADIAKASGRDVAEIRSAYPTKEELLIAAFRAGQKKMEASLRQVISGSLDEYIAHLFDALMDGLAPYGAEVHLNLAYQATKDKILLEIVKRSSQNVNFAVKAYLAQMVTLSIIDQVDEVEKVNQEMVASFIEYLAGTLEGKKLPAIKKAWSAHVRTMLKPSFQTTVPQVV